MEITSPAEPQCAFTRMAPVDVDRLALLLLTAVELSEAGYVLLRYVRGPGPDGAQARNDQWRVNVRFAGMEHTSAAQVPPRARREPQRWQCLLLALDRAAQWLRASHARVQLTRAEESTATTTARSTVERSSSSISEPENLATLTSVARSEPLLSA